MRHNRPDPTAAIPELTVETFINRRAAPPPQIVDVREPEEWAAGRIAGALLIPLGELPERLAEIDPARPVVAVCRSGRRSLDATEFLIASGFADVHNLAGGMLAWVEAGQPVEC